MFKKIRFKISGIHCRSCKILIEEEVKEIKGVSGIDVDHVKGEAVLRIGDEKSVGEVYEAIMKLGYNVDDEEKSGEVENRDSILLTSPKAGTRQAGVVLRQLSDPSQKDSGRKFFFGVGILMLFVLGYFLVQYFGGFEILAKLNEREVSYGLIFLIGVLASFHCVGMCGGLVVAYSTHNAQRITHNEKKYTFINSHFQYNIGRLLSYTVIGGILGGVGSFFGINPNFSGMLMLVAGFFMVLMGLSIMTKFKWLEMVKLRTPEFIAKFLYKNKKSDKPKGPLVIGLLTGFMPCGPLQAMQLFALTTGSIYNGAISMFLYSLGTIPLMFGFGSVISMISNVKLKQILKISGVVVVVLGLFMLNRGLANFGIGVTSFLPTSAQSENKNLITGGLEKYQTVEMDVTYSGYSPNVIYLKKDVPVKWIIKDKGITGCTNEIFLYHESGTIKKKLNQKENVIEFTPTKLGELKFSCWMSMVWGKFIVTEDGNNKSSSFNNKEAGVAQASGGCASCANADTCANAKTGGCTGGGVKTSSGSCGGGCGSH